MRFRIPLPQILAFLCLFSIALGHEDNSSLRHWEKASPDPDRIFLTFLGDPATSRAVTWRTDTSVVAAVAEIAPATAFANFPDSAIRVDAVTTTVNMNISAFNEQGPVNYHSVTFDGLEPETLYAYRVGGGKDYWSEWIQFRTASSENKPFQFVYFGDAQNNILSHWSRNIRMAYQTAPDAAFVIHAGDLVNEGHKDQEWAEWHKAGGFIHSQWTGIPVVGNHELRHLAGSRLSNEKVLSILWRPQFTLPEPSGVPSALRETVYSIDYQGLRVIVLNSMQDTQSQTAFLEQELIRPGADWTVVTSHYSIFSTREGRDFTYGREVWKPLFDKYGVDLVLNGHDHAYAVGQVPVRMTDETYGDDFQTLYVTSVSGKKQYKVSGVNMKRWEADGYEAINNAEFKQFFQVIDVDGNKFTYRAYTADGQLYDEVRISKDLETGKKTVQ